MCHVARLAWMSDHLWVCLAYFNRAMRCSFGLKQSPRSMLEVYAARAHMANAQLCHELLPTAPGRVGMFACARCQGKVLQTRLFRRPAIWRLTPDTWPDGGRSDVLMCSRIKIADIGNMSARKPSRSDQPWHFIHCTAVRDASHCSPLRKPEVVRSPDCF
jgi:hypothetical protein